MLYLAIGYVWDKRAFEGKRWERGKRLDLPVKFVRSLMPPSLFFLLHLLKFLLLVRLDLHLPELVASGVGAAC